MVSSTDPGEVAYDFSVYWGFGKPLNVVDDRQLLAEMAFLKQRALSPHLRGGDPLHGRTMVPNAMRGVLVLLGLLDALNPRTWRRNARGA